LDTHDQHTHRLLSEIEAGSHLSQRSLARNLGIALGLTNLLLRRLVRKGWVRMIHIRPNRVTYLLTPTGIAEKARMSRDSLKYSLRFYSEARQRVGARFASLSNDWPPGGSAEKRIVFFGTGEIAEVGYVCLQETDLQLVGAIDDQGRKRFFDVPLHRPEWLRQSTVAGTPFSRLVVMSFDDVDRIARQLTDLGVQPDRICWL
jgi:DNA-binding MarR family transcriptional regulator